MARRKKLRATQIFELEEGLEKLGGPVTIEEGKNFKYSEWLLQVIMDQSSKYLLWIIVKKTHPLRLDDIDEDYWNPDSCQCVYEIFYLCNHCFLSYFIKNKSEKIAFFGGKKYDIRIRSQWKSNI